MANVIHGLISIQSFQKIRTTVAVAVYVDSSFPILSKLLLHNNRKRFYFLRTGCAVPLYNKSNRRLTEKPDLNPVT